LNITVKASGRAASASALATAHAAADNTGKRPGHGSHVLKGSVPRQAAMWPSVFRTDPIAATVRTRSASRSQVHSGFRRLKEASRMAARRMKPTATPALSSQCRHIRPQGRARALGTNFHRVGSRTPDDAEVDNDRKMIEVARFPIEHDVVSLEVVRGQDLVGEQGGV